MAMNSTASGGFSRRKLLKTSAGLGAGAALSGLIPGLSARADTKTLNMWWWGEQELPGLQAFVEDSVKNYHDATVKTMLQDTAVVISQFQTAAAAHNSPVTKSLSDHPISGAITTTSMAIWPSTVAINTSASVSSV